MTISGIVNGGIAAIGCAVDANRAGRHLRDGHNVRKLAARQPVPVLYCLVLDERQHAIASTKTKKAYLEERNEQIEEYHFSPFI